MKLLPLLFLLFALNACGVPGADEAGPAPANYRDVIVANMPETPMGPKKQSYGSNNLDALFNASTDRTPIDPQALHNVQISEPQPGRLQFVPGWRVCLKAQIKLYDLRPDFSNPDKIPNVIADKGNPYKGPDVYSDTRRYTPPQIWAYFFVGGTLNKIVRDDPPCTSYTYTAWPELSDIGQKGADKYLHPKWEYGTDYDYLQQTNTGFASLISKNHYDLRFPNTGGTHAIIGIVKTQHGLQAQVMLDRGLIVCKGSCTMQTRFDSDPVETIAFDHNENNDKSVVEVHDSARFTVRLQTSYDLVIGLPITGNGTKQFLFSTADFDPTKIGIATTTTDPFLPLADDGMNYDLPSGKAAK